MPQVKLTILGEPMGKQRPKATTIGKFVQVYTPKETTNYESRVVYEYRQKHSDMLFEPHKEIWATIVAYFPITKQHYKYHKKTNTTDLDKEGREMLEGTLNPLKKPDLDNIAKICLDALNGIAYPDDSAITCLLVMKKYSENPRVELTLEGRE